MPTRDLLAEVLVGRVAADPRCLRPSGCSKSRPQAGPSRHRAGPLSSARLKRDKWLNVSRDRTLPPPRRVWRRSTRHSLPPSAPESWHAMRRSGRRRSRWPPASRWCLDAAQPASVAASEEPTQPDDSRHEGCPARLTTESRQRRATEPAGRPRHTSHVHSTLGRSTKGPSTRAQVTLPTGERQCSGHETSKKGQQTTPPRRCTVTDTLDGGLRERSRWQLHWRTPSLVAANDTFRKTSDKNNREACPFASHPKLNVWTAFATTLHTMSITMRTHVQ